MSGSGLLAVSSAHGSHRKIFQPCPEHPIQAAPPLAGRHRKLTPSDHETACSRAPRLETAPKAQPPAPIMVGVVHDETPLPASVVTIWIQGAIASGRPRPIMPLILSSSSRGSHTGSQRPKSTRRYARWNPPTSHPNRRSAARSYSPSLSSVRAQISSTGASKLSSPPSGKGIFSA
jgi:hypothetical protein